MRAGHILGDGDARRQIVIGAGNHAGLANADETAHLDRGVELAQRGNRVVLGALAAGAIESCADHGAKLDIDAVVAAIGDDIDEQGRPARPEGEIMHLAAQLRHGNDAIIVRPFIAWYHGGADADREVAVILHLLCLGGRRKGQGRDKSRGHKATDGWHEDPCFQYYFGRQNVSGGLQVPDCHHRKYLSWISCSTGAPLIVKLAERKLGAPKRSTGLREKPTPSRGMPAKVSSRPLRFSS